MPFVSEHPDLPGWRFTISEISNGVCRIDGRDPDGRSISRTGAGGEEDQLMQACIRDATELCMANRLRGFSFLKPWQKLADDAEGQKKADLLLGELIKEIHFDHPLSGLPLRAVAMRQDQDDVLFEVLGRGDLLAVVHLTWQKEIDSRWPHTELFSSWQHWMDAVMIPDHEDFTCGDTQ